MKRTKAVSMCQFQRSKGMDWEDGIAVTDAPGGSIQMIFPTTGTTHFDVVSELYDVILRPENGTFTFQGE